MHATTRSQNESIARRALLAGVILVVGAVTVDMAGVSPTSASSTYPTAGVTLHDAHHQVPAGGPRLVYGAAASGESAVTRRAARAADAFHEPLTASQTQLVAWARARFRAAGLEVPLVTVAFTPDRQNCEGFVGLYRPTADTVNICADEHASDLVLRSLMLHEMSHAWAEEKLTPEVRATFVELRGASTWNSWDYAWRERATEHAAVAIAWGLMDVETTVMPVGDTSTDALQEAFRFLTGADPINDGSVPSPHPTKLVAPSATRVR